MSEDEKTCEMRITIDGVEFPCTDLSISFAPERSAVAPLEARVKCLALMLKARRQRGAE